MKRRDCWPANYVTTSFWTAGLCLVLCLGLGGSCFSTCGTSSVDDGCAVYIICIHVCDALKSFAKCNAHVFGSYFDPADERLLRKLWFCCGNYAFTTRLEIKRLTATNGQKKTTTETGHLGCCSWINILVDMRNQTQNLAFCHRIASLEFCNLQMACWRSDLRKNLTKLHSFKNR